MVNIVEFPLSSQRPKRKRLRAVAQPVDLKAHVHNAQVQFTCVHCGSEHHMQFDNMIFKTVDLFCGKCGHGWKITNPMFITRKGEVGS